MLANKWFKNTGSWLINTTFWNDPSLGQYGIATEEVSGFPFVIESNIWETYTLVEVLLVTKILERWNFNQNVITGVINFMQSSTGLAELVFPDINDYYFILTSPLIIEQNKFNEKSQDLGP